MKKGLFYFLITLIITTLIIINCDSSASSDGSSNKGDDKKDPIVTTAPEINIKNNTVDITDDTIDYAIGSTETGTPLDVVFTIENTGTGDLQLLTSPAIDLSGDTEYILLSDASTDIAKETSTTFTIRFNPSAAGTFTSEVIIANNDNDEGNYNFFITAEASDPVILNPEIDVYLTTNIPVGTTENIGTVVQDNSDDFIFTIYNNGTGDLDLTGTPIVSISGSSAFTSNIDNTDSTIASGNSTTFTITFTPPDNKNHTTDVTIINTDSDEGTYTFTIKGKGSKK